LLYLQLCNALRQDPRSVRKWLDEAGVGCTPEESDTACLHKSLQEVLGAVFDACPETVGKLATFLDSGIDAATAEKTDFTRDGNPRIASCGWCPEESWREGAIFAVELLRICRALIDPIERIELLEIACALQLLRSLCAQSARYGRNARVQDNVAGPLKYTWALSDPDGRNTVTKQISRRNLNALQRMIYEALRDPAVKRNHTERDYSFLEEVASHFTGNDENTQQTDEEIALAALDSTAEDKLTGFALRLVLTDHLGIPHQDQPDLLAEAEAAFAPPKAKSSKPKSVSKSKKAPTEVKAPKKAATKKQKAA
jgi:hypothetical protein